MIAKMAMMRKGAEQNAGLQGSQSVHGSRNEQVVKTQGSIITRMIQQMKETSAPAQSEKPLTKKERFTILKGELVAMAKETEENF